MPAKFLFYYSCGHTSGVCAPNAEAEAQHAKKCPVCHNGGVSLVEFQCDMCATPAQTTASGLGRLQRFLCPNCRKLYNRWESMARKAKNEGRSYPGLQQYAKARRQTPVMPPGDTDEAECPEPPLTKQEFKDIAKFGKRASPCAQCEYIAHDKNLPPCSACPKLTQYAKTPDKIFLDSLYV